MKTKTKKKIKHVLAKKLLKKKSSRRALRAFTIIVTVASMGSLVYAVATTKPTVDISLQATHKTRSITISPAEGTISTLPLSDQNGQASWYALGLPAPDSHTCASTTYPRGTYLEVTNKRNGQKVICLVNDYGPEAWTGRAIDLSRGSFSSIENLGRGTLPAEIRVVPTPPLSLKLSFPENFTATTGYSLCLVAHNADYCETHRQQSGNPD